MREQIVEFGIIVRTVKTGESDLRLTLFTASGLKYATAKGVLKPRAKMASAVGLFTVGEFTIAGSTVTGVSVLVSPFSIGRDINRYYLANSIADTLLHLEFVEQTAVVLVLAADAITELAETKVSAYRIFIDYFSAVFRILGYSLDLEYNKEAKLTLQNAKKCVRKITDAFLLNADYKIKFTESFL
jgi:recombinational DNA repair protein (RecF pathway)